MSSLTRASSVWCHDTQSQVESVSPSRKLRQFETELGIGSNTECASRAAPIAPMGIGVSGEEETVHRCHDGSASSSAVDAISSARSSSHVNALMEWQTVHAQHINSFKRPAQSDNSPARQKKVRSFHDGPEVSDPAVARATCLITLKLTPEKLSRFTNEQTSSPFDLVPDLSVNAQPSEKMSREATRAPAQLSFASLESVNPKQEQMETIDTRNIRQAAAVETPESVESTSGAWKQPQVTCVEDHVLRDLCIHVRQVGSVPCHIWLHLAAYPNRDALFAKLDVVQARFPHLGEHEISSITVISTGANCGYSTDIEKEGVAGAKAFDSLLSWSRSQGASIIEDFTAGLNVD